MYRHTLSNCKFLITIVGIGFAEVQFAIIAFAHTMV